MRRMLTVALCGGLLLSGCASTSHSTQSATPSTPPSTHGSATPASGTGVSKVLVFVVENHSLDQMRTQMPYTFGLAQQYGYTTAYQALTHPSLGNYIGIAAGSTFGITDDRNPIAHPLHGPSVFSQALAAGKTAALYAEGMPVNCSLQNGGNGYAVRHNPWTYFVDDRAACGRDDVPLTRLTGAIDSGQLPNVGMVIPNLCNDAHDCSLATADDWLRGVVGDVLAGPDWRSGHLAIVITADEDDHHQNNTVLTTVMQPSLRHVVINDPLTHLSLSRFLSEVVGQPPLRDAQGATSLGEAFGLHPST